MGHWFHPARIARTQNPKTSVRQRMVATENIVIKKNNFLVFICYRVFASYRVFPQCTNVIVIEFMSKGSLVFRSFQNKLKLLKPKNVQMFSLQLVRAFSDTSCGMAYLESKQLVHRDLAARNVLIAEDGTAKVF